MEQNKVIRLDYRAREASAPPWFAPWLPVLRVFALGPLTGGGVGFAQATAALMVCRFHGMDYFYLHTSAIALYFVLIVGGAAIGIPYGGILWAYEWLSGRRIQLIIAIPLLVLVACAAETVITTIHIRHPLPFEWVFFMPKAIAIAFGLLLSLATAQRDEHAGTGLG